MSGSGRRAPAALLAIPAVLTLGGIAAAVLAAGNSNDGRAAAGRGGRTVAVTRQTLVERETVEGTLGYAGARTVLNRLSGSDPSKTTASADAPAAIPAALFVPDEKEPEQGGDQPPDSEDQPADSDQPPDSEDPSPGEAPEEESDDSPDDGSSPGGSSSEDSPPSDSSAEGSSPSGGSRPGASPSSGDGSSDDDSASGSGGGSGTVTALARPGSVVRRGGVLYRLDGEPVLLMYGSTPAYRELEAGISDGPDVRQLERNLAALGFDPGIVDATFTSTTAAAVADWQDALGLPETGTVELGRVVFLPGPRRIGELKTAVGSVLSAGSEVLETSSTKRVVTVELDAALQSLARTGEAVEVTLPDQSTVRGRITEVGRVAREKDSSGTDPGAEAEQELVIDVTVRLRSARRLGRLDETPVSVGLAQESRRNVLAVPVDALVARRGGGYGVELAADRRIVPVRTGLFADGYVEVSGSGIRAGTRVVVPDA
jgi:peptidoglycan hydrolase-like protein with peptidoglycan-binding domain